MNTLERLKELAGKATPGPWEEVDNSWEVSTIYDSRGNGIIRCYIQPCLESSLDEKGEELADAKDALAKLITSLLNNAEALLEVAEAALGRQQYLTPEEERISFNKLDTALAKLEVEA
jgi:hypothetical protein